MEKAIRKIKVPVYLVIVALLVVAAIVVGIYFLINGSKSKEPSRGTYVMTETEEQYL